MALPEDDMSLAPAVRQYMLLCLVALGVMVLALLEDNLGWWGVLPFVVGSMAVVSNWSGGPVLVLLSVLCLAPAYVRGVGPFQFFQMILLSGGLPILRRGLPPRELATSTDLLFCAAMLTYFIGHFRLLSLIGPIFPPDRRPAPGGKRRGPATEEVPRRSPDLVPPHELIQMILTLPVWCGAAYFAWMGIASRRSGIPELTPRHWRLLVLCWGSTLVLAIGRAVIGYLGRSVAPPQESLLYLQDQLWIQTRSAQSTFNRMLTALRLRGQRKEEKG
jgi:hypothetical protein